MNRLLPIRSGILLFGLVTLAIAAPTADKVLSKLTGAQTEGTSGTKGNGLHYSWDVRLQEVTAEVETDKVVEGLHIEKFTVRGKWSAHVRKDEYSLGIMINKHWGENKNPYGNFSIRAKAVDGAFTVDTIVDVENYNDEGNRFARDKAYDLLTSRLKN